MIDINSPGFYYSADGNKFFSKIEAILYKQQNNQKIFYYYNDHIYDKILWTIEPPESLQFYYKEQAQKIRDSYNYVVLCYSGGYDSTNILETFYYNNIKLDKIVIVGAFSQDTSFGVDENHNGELYHNAFPYLKELGLDSITQICDYTKYFDNVKNFSISSYDEKWVDKIGGWFSPHNWFWKDLENHVIPKEWRNKKTAIIMGKDKPGLFYSPKFPTEKFTKTGIKLNSFCFRDTPVNSYGNSNGIDNIERINFYWDPYYPNILIKQLHMLYKVYNSCLTSDYDESSGVTIYGKLNTNDIIYNLKKPLAFKSPKSLTSILSLRDNYLLNKKNSDVYDLYKTGIDFINSNLNLRKLPVIQTKHYSIIS